MPNVSLSVENGDKVTHAVKLLKHHLDVLVRGFSASYGGNILPVSFTDMREAADSIIEEVVATNNGVRVPRPCISPKHGRIILLALKMELLRRHQEVERNEHKTNDQQILAPLRNEIRLLEKLAKELTSTFEKPAKLPSLADHLNLEVMSAGQRSSLPPRRHDEKFHILSPPYQFGDDFQYYLRHCGWRSRPVAVAFVDIDHFKRLNDEFTHQQVDRFVLPRFMGKLEALTFARGHAYREGGDEYFIILPNAGAVAASQFLHKLRRSVSGLKFPPLDTCSLTVSCGFVVAHAADFLTTKQVKQRANDAGIAAKGEGRDCVVKWKDGKAVVVAEPAEHRQ